MSKIGNWVIGQEEKGLVTHDIDGRIIDVSYKNRQERTPARGVIPTANPSGQDEGRRQHPAGQTDREEQGCDPTTGNQIPDQQPASPVRDEAGRREDRCEAATYRSDIQDA